MTKSEMITYKNGVPMTQKFRLYKIQIGWKLAGSAVVFELFMEHYCIDTLRSAVSNMLAPQYSVLNVEVSDD